MTPLVAPVLTPVTVSCSPLRSGSVSLVSRLPVGSVPSRPLFRPPASMAVAVSAVATGASLAPWMVMVTLAWLVAPLASCMV
ncbi:hypothetical protein D3C87_1566770 [compost metagenome]